MAAKNRDNPLILSDLATLQTLASGDSNVAVSYLATLALGFLVGGVRFAHAQRSVLKDDTAEGLVFHCKQGKNRHGGQPSPPFDWACPVSSFFCNELVQRLKHFVTTVLPESGGFMVPCLASKA